MPNWFSVRNVSPKEVRRHLSSNIQPKRVKQVCTSAQISTPKSPEDSYTLGREQLYDETRHIASLFSPAYRPQSSTLFVPKLSRKSISNDVPPIRPGQCSSGFCESYKLDCTHAKGARYNCSSISGRLPCHSQRPRYSTKSIQLCRKILREIRLANKSRKVIENGYNEIRIPWDYMGYETKPEVTITGKERSSRTSPRTFNKETTLELAQRESYLRETELRFLCRTPGSPSQPSSPTRIEPFTSGKTRIAVPDVSTHLTRTTLVETEFGRRLTDTHTGTLHLYDNGCCRQRLGCRSERSETLGLVDGIPKKVAQQSKRTLHRIRSHIPSSTNAKEPDYYAADRQQNYGSLLNEARGNQIIEATRKCKENPGTLSDSSLSSGCSLHTGSLQRVGGRPLTRKRPPGVASQASGNSGDIPQARHSGSGPVCVKEVGCGPDLCQRRCEGFTQHIYGRFQRDMGVQTGMDFPTTNLDTPGNTPPGLIKRHIPDSGPELEQSFLGSRPQETSPLPTNANKEPEHELNRPTDEPSTTTRRKSKFIGLESTGWTAHLKNWSEEDLNLLEASWRKSTMKTYKPAWFRWQRWADNNKIPVNDPSPADLAKYICHLYNNVKLAPRTIAVHKSVVTTLANPERTEELSSSGLVKHALKAVFSKKPTIKKPIPWKVNDLLDFLRSYHIDENSLFQIFRHTCVLLLLASGRRVHDLTLLSIRQGSLMDSQDEIILWPDFGSKTDSGTYRQSGWVLKANNNDGRLNLVSWIRKSISASQARRANKKLDSLFITTRGAVKKASRSVIAGWIRTIFREAGISASAGSFRAAVASENWTNNRYDIDEILKMGNWRSKTTFFKHYFRETPASSNCGISSSAIRNISDDFSTL